MAEYYGRLFEIQLGKDLKPFIEATSGRQFKMLFNVLLDWRGYQSYMDISIYNLSRETAAKVFKKNDKIALQAGYENRIDYLFQGKITNILPERIGPNRITRVYARGGARELEESTITKTLGEGSALPEVIKACASAMGLPAVINGSALSNVTYSGGYAMHGDPKKILASLAKTHDFNWLVENQKLVVIGKDSKRSGQTHQISALTGMEGSPELTEVGANVVTRLNPKIKIGQLFKINSEYPRANFSNVYFQDIPETVGQGTYRAERIEHSGDSHGDTWSTKLTGLKFNE